MLDTNADDSLRQFPSWNENSKLRTHIVLLFPQKYNMTMTYINKLYITISNNSYHTI